MDGKARQCPIRAKFAWIRRSRRALYFNFQKKEENGDRSLVASLEYLGLFFSRIGSGLSVRGNGADPAVGFLSC